MNERIKKFAEQAAKFSAIMALPTGQSGNELFVAKFAELIVRECANFLKDTMDDHFAAEQLEEHFGVGK